MSILKRIQKTLGGGRPGQKSVFNARAIIAVLVFGMIIAVFVLSDLSGKQSGQMGAGSAAEVNGEIISLKEFQDQENRVSNYYTQLFGGQFDVTAQRKQILAETMNELVNKSVAVQAAEKAHVFATDLEVKKMIQDIPNFKRDGVFQSDAYRATLAANRLTPYEFESSLRQQIVVQKVRQLFEIAYGASNLEKAVDESLKSAQLNIQYARLNPESFNSAANISDTEAKNKLADTAFKTKVDEYYKTHTSEFESPAQVRASHILIRATSENDQDVKKAEAKAKEVLAKTKKEDFGKLAVQYSEDPGSKTNKGDLGFFSQGRMVKEFEDAAFKMEKGQVSDVIKSAFGFHIIKVVDKKAAHKTTLEQAQLPIARKLMAEEKYLALSKELEGLLASGNTNGVDTFLAQHKLSWSESGFYSLSAETVPQINSAAVFKASLELTKDHPMTKTLVRDGEMQYIVRLKDTKKITASVNPPDVELVSKQKSFGGYQKWVESFRKDSRVVMNEQLLQ